MEIGKEKKQSNKQMYRGTFLLKYLSVLIFLQISQTCNARKTKDCVPSSCGHIHNIAFPFRLNTDPKHCGDPQLELTCEGNQTILSSNNKLYVQAINYDNQTFRLVDPTLQKQDICSLIPQLTFREYNTIVDSYYYREYRIVAKPIFLESNGVFYDSYYYSKPIFMLNCPSAIHTSTFLEITGCKNRYRYIKIGEMNASQVSDGCTVEFIALTSWPVKDGINVSLSDFQQAITYGFELRYYLSLRRTWITGFILGILRSGYYFPHSLNTFLSLTREPPSPYNRGYCTGLVLELFITALGARFVIGLPIIIVFLVIKFKRRHLSMFDMIEGFLQTQNNFMPIRYNYSNIKRMTKGFKQKLGEGGFGCVYKGKLRSGTDVAVKMLTKPQGGGQDFMNEVGTIGRIHHVNVVRLVGYCVERSKCALVYDFMPNGSLDKHITSQEGSGSPLLSWQRKYEIVLGVARGIEYLHRGCDIQILHFDIKPHNILLDENFIPKISDFGLAKLYPTDNSIVTLTAARGTIGYVAPELINRSIGPISYKADVYSFGMLLMQMLDLKRNVVANEENSSQYFPSWIYDKLNKGKEIDLVDEEANEDEKKITRKMTLIALWCILTNPLQRPSMSRVVEMLEGHEDEVVEVPPQPLQSQPIVSFHPIMESSTFSSDDSIALLENSSSNPLELETHCD